MTMCTQSEGPALRGLPLYALIDPYFLDYPEHGIDLAACCSFDSLRAARRSNWHGYEIYLAEGDDPVREVSRLPYLVSLADAEKSMIDTLAEAAVAEQRAFLAGDPQPYRIGALIETWMAPQDLIRRLEKMWAYSYKGGGHHRYLHIADRRAFETVVHLFDTQTIARWLGPIARWHYLGRDFDWRPAQGEADSNDGWYVDAGFGMRRAVAPERAMEGAVLQIGLREHQRLREGEAVSRALTRWQRAGRDVDAQTYELAWAGVQVAIREGLVQPEDKGAFAYRWMIDPDCAGCPPVGPALARSRLEARTFVSVLNETEFRSIAETHFDTANHQSSAT